MGIELNWQTKIVISLMIFFVFQCFTVAQSFADPAQFPKPIQLNKADIGLKFYPQILILEDAENNLSPDNVYQKILIGSASRLPSEVPNFGITKSAFWFYFEIDTISQDKNWNLLIEHHLIREVDIHQLEDGIWRPKLYSGTSRPWLNRKIDNAYFIYPFEQTNKKQVFLLRVLNKDPLIVPLSFISAENLQKKLSFSHWISGLYWGLIMGLILYNSFLYISTQQKSYLYYVIYTISFAGYLLIHEPWSHSFAFSDQLWLSDNGIHLSIPLIMACALYFTINFLNIEKFFPRVFKIGKMIIFWCLLLLLAAPWMEPTFHTKLMMITLQFFSISIILVAIKAWQKGCVDAPFFLFAWSFLIAGALTTNLMYFGVLPFNWFTASASNIGGCVEMLLLSFALASSINRTRKQQKATESAHYKMLKEHVTSLAKTNQYKDNFLNIISHELRTPLHGIRASLDLVLEKIKNKDTEKEFALLDSSAAEMERRISDLLIFTDLGSGKFQLNNKPFEPRSLIDELQSKFKLLAEDKCLGWQFSCDENLPKWLIGDQQYVKLIYSQLLDNAIKFTTTGYISTFFDVTSNGVLQVNIRDTGIGFEEASLEELDQAFVQGNSAINRSSGGLGLGLTLCKQLVTLMHGNFSFESKIGVGTNVTVSIPAIITAKPQCLSSKQDELDSQNELSEVNTGQTEVVQKDTKILIVEDNHVNRMVMGNMIKHLGHQISFAENGQLGVDICQQQKFDLILMDCQMPVMDGITATKIIRKEGLNQETPIVAVTANAMSSDNEICLNAGMNQHLPKPVRLNDLTASIKYWIELSNVN